MRIALFFVALSVLALAGALPDDATLSQRLLGTWRGGRHSTRYGRLIETWRFEGECTDSSTVQEIIEPTETHFRFRTLSQDGPGRPEGLVLPSGVYTETRIPDAKLPHDK